MANNSYPVIVKHVDWIMNHFSFLGDISRSVKAEVATSLVRIKVSSTNNGEIKIKSINPCIKSDITLGLTIGVHKT